MNDQLDAYLIGEQPGAGIYRCCKCSACEVSVRGPEDQLPPCRNCGSAGDVIFKPVNEVAKQS